MTGEQKLFAAVLIMALRDAVEVEVGHSIISQVRADRARTWIDADGCKLGGFRWVCEILQLDADAIRDQIRRHGARRGRFVIEARKESARRAG